MSFPKPMAALADNLGNKGLSSMYYERIYLRNKTPWNMYRALDKFIINGNDKKIIKYAPMFMDLADYKDIVYEINATKREFAGDNEFILAFACNEDDRIKTAYVAALLHFGQREAAEIFYFEKIFTPTFIGNVDLNSPSYIYYFLFNNGEQDSMYEKFREYFFAFKGALITVEEGGGEIFIARYFVDFIEESGIIAT